MGGYTLSVVNDATYPDHPTDTTVALHQQIHDTLAIFADQFEADLVPDAGQVWARNPGNTLWYPTALPAIPDFYLGVNSRLVQGIQAGPGITVIPDTAGEAVTISSQSSTVLYGGDPVSLADL